MKALLHWAAAFFHIAILAALLEFAGIAAGVTGFAKVLFIVFLAFAVAALSFGRLAGPPRVPSVTARTRDGS